MKAKPTFNISQLFFFVPFFHCGFVCQCVLVWGSNDTESYNIFNAPTFFLRHFKRPNKKAKKNLRKQPQLFNYTTAKAFALLLSIESLEKCVQSCEKLLNQLIWWIYFFLIFITTSWFGR